MSQLALRNLAIVLGLAGLGVVWQQGFSESTGALRQLISLLFIALIAYAVYRYFSSNRLTWYAIPQTQRYVFIACMVAALALLLVGMPLLGSVITPLGVILLIAALVLVMVWIVRESRRF